MKKINITYFQRKRRVAGNYSVEFIFEDVRNRLIEHIYSKVVISKFESSGVFKRIYNTLEAAFNQNQVNHITGDVSFLGILLKKNKTIQTILDVVYLDRSKGIKQNILKFFWLTLPEKRCRFITAISESTKREILKYHPCNPDKIIVIPVAVSEDFKPYPKEFNSNKPVILQLGTAPNKNIPNLIKALQGLNCHLEIVGKKDAGYIELLKNSGISYNYSQDLSASEVLDKYNSADIITLVSTYEGFGMPILEGQAVGRPVITSNIFSMPEVAGDAAVLVDPYDISSIRKGFEKIINDKNFRSTLVDKGFKNSIRYNPEVIAKQYLELYQKIT